MYKKLKLEYIVIILFVFAILLSGCIGQGANKGAKTTQIDNGSLEIDIEDAFIPKSFDEYYKVQPSKYLLNMYDLSTSMENVVIDLQDGNIENAKNSFEKFSQNYNNSLNMIPEWKEYYDQGEVDNLGDAINSGNISKSLEMVDYVKDACTDCHTEIRPVVWATYKWKDFRNIKMNTTNPNESQISWIDAKSKYLLPGFEGIGINIRKGQKNQAIKSFKQFRSMFNNMKDTCSACHVSERKYYVDDNVMSMIDSMENEISTGNLTKAEEIRLGIGVECHKCHTIHEPLQRIKELEVD